MLCVSVCLCMLVTVSCVCCVLVSVPAVMWEGREYRNLVGSDLCALAHKSPVSAPMICPSLLPRCGFRVSSVRTNCVHLRANIAGREGSDFCLPGLTGNTRSPQGRQEGTPKRLEPHSLHPHNTCPRATLCLSLGSRSPTMAMCQSPEF